MTPLTPIDVAPLKPGHAVDQADLTALEATPDFAALVIAEDVVVTDQQPVAPDLLLLERADPTATPDAAVDAPTEPELPFGDPKKKANLADNARSVAEAAPTPDGSQKKPVAAASAQVSLPLQPVAQPLPNQEIARDPAVVSKPSSRDGVVLPTDAKTAAPYTKNAPLSEQKPSPTPVSFVQSVLQQKMPVPLPASPQMALTLPGVTERTGALPAPVAHAQQIPQDGISKPPQLTKQPDAILSTLAVVSEPTSKLARPEPEMTPLDKGRLTATDNMPTKPVVTAPSAVAPLPVPQPVIAEGQTPLVITQGGDAEVLQSFAVSDRAVATQSTGIVVNGPTQGGEIARQVTHQIAQAVIQHQGRVTEIALNPEELGRLRLSMTAIDTAITLSVAADRPETADLLRRHIDVLTQEFRALGYDDISFSFEGGGETETDPDGPAESFGDDTTASEETVLTPLLQPATGLDLRL